MLKPKTSLTTESKMKSQKIQRWEVVALVATRDRTKLLRSRSLKSILRQSHKPSRIVIVDDSRKHASQEEVRATVQELQQGGYCTDLLKNRRTPGASGTWNSGLDHIRRQYKDPTMIYVAFLDDDDSWCPSHIKQCLKTALSKELDVVATSFKRVTDNGLEKVIEP
ncbi:MAG: glycosyltransferase family A protein, partial [Candidatus Methanomethylicaceae archaeon]